MSLAALVAASVVFAYALLFVTFVTPDDEGYFLLALRAHRAGASLYGDIATIYGPFYFEVVGALFRWFAIPLDHVAARWFALAVVVLAALGISHYVRRMTGSALAALVAYFLAFVHLCSLATTPLHPTGLVTLLLSALVLATLGLESPSRRSLALAVCGALTAAIALTKLNAGCFVVLAFAALFTRFAPSTRTTRWARIGVSVGLPLVPLVLMRAQLGEPGILSFALVISLSLITFGFLGAPDASERSLSIRPYLAGAVALTLVVLAPCVFGESGWNGLWNTLVLGTLRFPGAFVAAPELHPGAELALALVIAPIVLVAQRRARWRIATDLVALLKLAGGLMMIALCFGRLPDTLRALPLVWLVALPGRSLRRGLATRTLLGLLVVLLGLHAYPIGGNQALLAGCLLPAAGIVTVCDAIADVPSISRAFSFRAAWRVLGSAAVVSTLMLHTVIRWTLPRLATYYRKNVPLELPGAESLRLPESQVAELQWTAKNLAQNGATFVGIPGLHSFYFWSTLAPPVRFYPNTWVLFYDDAQQEQLADALLSSPRPCLVRKLDTIQFYTGQRELDGPMARVAAREFETAGNAGEYELLIPRGARADLVLSVLTEAAPQPLRERFGIDRAMRLSFPKMPGVHFTRAVVHDCARNVDVLDSAAESSERRATIVDEDGRELIGGHAGGVVDLGRRSPLYLIGPTHEFAVRPGTMLVRSLDETGRVVARLIAPTNVR
jgi:hypothetical protein